MIQKQISKIKGGACKGGIRVESERTTKTIHHHKNNLFAMKGRESFNEVHTNFILHLIRNG